MAKKRDYTTSKKKLEEIIEEIENSDVTIDDLSKKVKEARELIEWCKLKLRSTQEELDKDLP